MALKWRDVVRKPEYRSLSDQDKLSARQEYFESVVVPEVEDEELEPARNEFNRFAAEVEGERLGGGGVAVAQPPVLPTQPALRTPQAQLPTARAPKLPGQLEGARIPGYVPRSPAALEQSLQTRMSRLPGQAPPKRPEGLAAILGEVGTEVLPGLAQGLVRNVRGIAGAVQAFGVPGLSLPGIGFDPGKEFAGQAVEALGKVEELPALQRPERLREGGLFEHYKDPTYWARALAENVTSIGLALVGGAVAGLPGRLATMFGMEGGSAYLQAKKDDAPENVAILEGMAVGALNTVLENLGLEAILRPARNVLTKAIKAALIEGPGTEAPQEVVNILAETIGHKPDQPLFSRENLERVVESAVIGAALGGGLGSVLGGREGQPQRGGSGGEGIDETISFFMDTLGVPADDPMRAQVAGLDLRAKIETAKELQRRAFPPEVGEPPGPPAAKPGAGELPTAQEVANARAQEMLEGRPEGSLKTATELAMEQVAPGAMEQRRPAAGLAGLVSGQIPEAMGADESLVFMMQGPSEGRGGVSLERLGQIAAGTLEEPLLSQQEAGLRRRGLAGLEAPILAGTPEVTPGLVSPEELVRAFPPVRMGGERSVGMRGLLPPVAEERAEAPIGEERAEEPARPVSLEDQVRGMSDEDLSALFDEVVAGPAAEGGAPGVPSEMTPEEKLARYDELGKRLNSKNFDEYKALRDDPDVIRLSDARTKTFKDEQEQKAQSKRVETLELFAKHEVKEGEKMEFVAPSFLPGTAPARISGTLKIDKRGEGYVSSQGRKYQLGGWKKMGALQGREVPGPTGPFTPEVPQAGPSTTPSPPISEEAPVAQDILGRYDELVAAKKTRAGLSHGEDIEFRRLAESPEVVRAIEERFGTRRTEGVARFQSEFGREPTPTEVNFIERGETDKVIKAERTKKFTEASVKGNEGKAFTPDNQEIDFEYRLVEANNLIVSHTDAFQAEPRFPAELQPKDRSRAALRLQVNEMANNLIAERLGANPSVTDGAPTVGIDSVVESGNGRLLAIKQAYRQGKAGRYKNWLADHAEEFGFSLNDVARMKTPALVRVRTTAVDRIQFVRDANVSTVSGVSVTERARDDARRLSPEILATLPQLEGAIEANRLTQPFLQAFAAGLPATERAAFMGPKGEISQEGLSRVRNAILHKAYGSDDVISRIAESLDNNSRNVTNAMTQVSPRWVKMRKDIAAGTLHDLDITNDMVSALQVYSRLRDEGRPLEAYFAQGQLFQKELTTEGEEILRMLDQYFRSGKKIGEWFNKYLDVVDAAGTPGQGSLFGASPPTVTEIILATNQRMEERHGEGRTPSLFGAGAATGPAGGGAEIGGVGPAAGAGAAGIGQPAAPGEAAAPAGAEVSQRASAYEEATGALTLSIAARVVGSGQEFAWIDELSDPAQALSFDDAKGLRNKGDYDKLQARGIAIIRKPEAGARLEALRPERIPTPGEAAAPAGSEVGQLPAPAPADLLKSAAQHGFRASLDAIKGLDELFGKGLKSFPGGIDPDTYARAKPLFQAAWDEAKAAGKDLRAFIQSLTTVLQHRAEAMKPYLMHFVREASTKEEAAPVTPQAAVTPDVELADVILADIRGEKIISKDDLRAYANAIYGGTQAQGVYKESDAYDAMELGVNRFLRDRRIGDNPEENALEPLKVVGVLEDLAANLPAQTARSQERQQFQQFSTPHALAYLSNWVANINENDVVLEPSAGTGNLAVFAQNMGAREVIGNEVTDRRRALLENLGLTRVMGENAEHISKTLPTGVKPTVVVMNPPFSAAGERMAGKRVADAGATHVEEALKALQPGGRLVAILGRGMFPGKIVDVSGRAGEGLLSSRWWTDIKKDYNVRAIIPLSGDLYKKQGTVFDNVIAVIDKTGPTVGDVLQPNTLTRSYEDLIKLLGGIRDERAITGERQPGQPAGEETPAAVAPEGAPGGGRSLPGPTGPVGVGPGPDIDQVGAPGAVPGEAVLPQPGGIEQTLRGGPAPAPGGRGGAAGVGIPGGRLPGPGAPGGGQLPGGGRPGGVTEVARPAPTAVFEQHKVRPLPAKGLKPYPAKLVESVSMAAISAPRITAVPNLPQSVIDKGIVADAQYENIAAAKQVHDGPLLPQGFRRGYFIGDSTGTGKTRQIIGILQDNWREGREKAVILSANKKLLDGTLKAMEQFEWDPKLVVDVGKFKPASDITLQKGILYSTYSTLQMEKFAIKKEAELIPGWRRVDQLVKWLGEDFDGVIIFDESHLMANAVMGLGGFGKQKASLQALAGLELQQRLSKARVVYASATGATEVKNLAYAERLGLWGEGTAFPDRAAFIGEIVSGGVAAMEAVAQNLKAMGLYSGRALSYEDVEYRRLTHKIMLEQEEIYDGMAKAWQTVAKNIESAIADSNAPASQRRARMSAFWRAQQYFFEQTLMSMQLPSVLAEIKAGMADPDGDAFVIQLVNTNAASQDRVLARMEEGQDLEELDLSPKEILMNYVQTGFPTIMYEDYLDDNGEVQQRQVLDSNKNPVENPDLVAQRDELLTWIGGIRSMDNPLTMILETFGTKNVAEVTGRQERIVLDEDGNRIREKWSEAKSKNDVNAFMDDRKRILVFSGAGALGQDYHADLDRKNQRKRRHYVIQAGWRAAAATQGFGRTHRLNQRQAPEIILVETNIKGQKRFISTIARRLDQLGALTRGQRQASGGIFDVRDNLESEYAQDAVNGFLTALAERGSGTIAGINPDNFQSQTGLSLFDSRTGRPKEKIDVPAKRFLNRLLMLPVKEQNAVFGAFSGQLDAILENAEQQGTLDKGIETIEAQKVEVQSEKIVHTDRLTGAETKYLQLQITQPTKKFTWQEVQDLNRVVFRNKQSSVLWAAGERFQRTDDQGHVTSYRMLVSPQRTSQRLEDGELKNAERWDRLGTESNAERAWSESIRALPATETHTQHLVAGALLPVWDRLGGKTKIQRIIGAGGERFLGRIIEPSRLVETLQRLGAEAEQVTESPRQMVAAILDNGYRADLANGWRIEKRRVAGEDRIEIIGPGNRDFDTLKRQGAFTEIVNFNTRVFIPTGENAATILEQVTRYRPVISLAPPQVRPQTAAGTARSRLAQTLGNQSGEVQLRTPLGREVFHDLAVLGRELIRAGADTFQRFRGMLKETLAENWPKVKHLAMQVYQRAKEPLVNELGTVGRGGRRVVAPKKLSPAEIEDLREVLLGLRRTTDPFAFTPERAADLRAKIKEAEKDVVREEGNPERVKELRGQIRAWKTELDRVIRTRPASINVERQNIPQELKDFEKEVAVLSPRKVQTWEETTRLSTDILDDPEQAAAVQRKAKRGEALNTEEMDAMRQIKANALGRLKEIAETSTPAEFNRQLKIYNDDVFRVTSDASSLAGRVLQIHQRMVGMENMGKALVRMERELNDREFQEFKKLNYEDPLEVQRFIARLGDPTLMEYFYEFFYGNILSGIPTHMVNIGSNTLWFTDLVGHRAVEAGVDSVIARYTGRPREVFASEVIPMLAGVPKGLRRGAPKAWEVIKTGQIQNFEDKWAREIGYGIVSAFERSPSKWMRKAAPWISMPTRALRAMDVWANAIAYDAQMGALARREGLKQGLKGEALKNFEQDYLSNPSEAAMLEAAEFGRHATFTDDPGKISNWIVQGRNLGFEVKAKVPKFVPFIGGARVGEIKPGIMVVPFVRTIGNLMKRGIEMTPGAGLLLARGQSPAQVIAKQIEGAVLAMVIMALFDDDRITGAAPKNEAERDSFYRQGKLAWGILLGDAWYQYRRVEPFNTVIASVVIAREKIMQAKDDDTATEIFGQVVDGIFNNLIDSGYLQGVTDVLDVHGRRRGMLQRMAASALVPYSSFWRSINRALDVIEEGETKVRESGTFRAAFSAVLPRGLIEPPPAKMNVWGEEITLPGGVFRQWLPWKISEAKDDPVEKFFERVGYYPGLPGKHVTIRGEDVELDDDIYRQYLVSYGRKARRIMELRVPMLNRIGDPEKAAKRAEQILGQVRRLELERAKRQQLLKTKRVERRAG